MNYSVLYLLINIISFILCPDTFAIERFSLEVVSPMKRVFKTTHVTNQENPLIEIWTARNEYESAQVAVCSESETSLEKIEISDLLSAQGTNRISRKCLTIRIPEYVHVEKNTKNTPASELDALAPEWFPDPLVEFTQLKFNGTRSVWITIYVPPDTAPGDYRGGLIIHTNTETRNVPIVLHVWRFTLPKTSSGV